MNMCAAAKFSGKIANFYDPHAIAIFITEESERTFADGLIVFQLADRHFRIFLNVLVDCGLDRFEFFLWNGSRMIEIEAQPIGRNQRTRLAHMRPKLPT